MSGRALGYVKNWIVWGFTEPGR